MKVTLNDINTTNNNTSSTLINSSYEPKSVLDLRRSPSPVIEKAVSNTFRVDPLHRLEKEEDHELNVNQQYLEDWDSLMRELGLNDDDSNIPHAVSNPFIDHHHQVHDSQDINDHHQLTATNHVDNLPHATETSFGSADNFNMLSDTPTAYKTSSDQSYLTCHLNNSDDWDVGFDYVDELIRLAECFETNSLPLGQAILARLNQRLTSPSGKPLQRACFYFKEALQSLLTGSKPEFQNSSDAIVPIIKAHKAFSTISPIPMFSSFTANQTVLEALENGFANVQVVDFDLGLGGHWASFIKELSARAVPPTVRVSAVVPHDYAAQSRLVRDSLTQFARELNIRFDVDILPLPTFEYLSFKCMKFTEGEKVIVLLSQSIFHHFGTRFLNDLRHVAPRVVVHVDYCDIVTGPTNSYRQTVIDGLEYYSTLLESIEAGANLNGGDSNWVTRIEMFVVYPKIFEVVVAGRAEAAREGLVAAGLRQVGLSKFAEFQAECLVRRVQIRGFNVVKRQGEMLLCWHDRPLVAASTWTYW